MLNLALNPREMWTRIRRLPWSSAAAHLVCALAAGAGVAQNLVTNPNFDADLNGWSRGAFVGVWSPEDAQESPQSGSARLVRDDVPSGGSFLVSSCIPVVGGTTYDLRADLRLPVPQPASRISLSVRTFPGPFCNGASLSGESGPRITEQDSTGLWTATASKITVPAEAGVVQIEIGSGKSEEGTAEYFVDNVEFCVEGTCEDAGPASDCVPDARTACLLDGRFRVRVDWTDFEANAGSGRVMEFEGERAESDESAFFWFFSATNFEIGVKMVDACAPPYDRFWVFTSGLTNVAYLVRVVDTKTGVERAYGNPLGVLPQAQGDTFAFLCD